MCTKCVASKQRILDSQLEDRARGLTEEQIQQLRCHFCACISDLVRQYRTASNQVEHPVRQRVAATASLYFRRFYLTNCFCLSDPRLVFVGCVYLASKAEESVLPAKHLVAFVRRQRPGWSYEMKHLLDMEMVLMEELNFDLIVFSPYRSLTSLLRDAKLGDAVGLRAWHVLNDSYSTDVSLLHPPHLVALAAIQIAAVRLAQQESEAGRYGGTEVEGGMTQQEGGGASGSGAAPGPPRGEAAQSTLLQQLSTWMATLNVDLDEVYDIVVDITTLYERFSVPMSVEESNRLLDAVQGVQLSPAMGQGGASMQAQLGGYGYPAAASAAFRR